jgi:phage gp36-like protein
MYVTAIQLADLPGPEELAQNATPPQSPTVSVELMDATLRGTDRSAFSVDEIAVADAALARITNAIAEASGLIDGFLARRYTLPLTSTPLILTAQARAIVRYKLNPTLLTDEKTNPIARDYRDALKLLEQIADGDFSIGVDDPQSAADPSALGVEFDPGTKVFGQEGRRNRCAY